MVRGYCTLECSNECRDAQDIKAGYDFGSKGIGLVRTEHMFFGAERLVEMRRFILSSSYEQRVEALNNIRKYQ